MIRALAAVGDVLDINCWSNIPYYFYHAGRRAHFFNEGLAIDLHQIRAPRAFWNLLAPIRGEKFGGFQFSRVGCETMARQIDWEKVNELVTHAQSFPPWELLVRQDIKFSHYIDFPLGNLFEDYGVGAKIGARTAREALAREKDQYAAATRVICMSPWAARQVVERCGTFAGKVHSIIPGANLPEALFRKELYRRPLDLPDGISRPLRIAFVGKLALRKGLDRLVEGLRILRSRGLTAIVCVIGPHENPYPREPSVEHLGFIDKSVEPERLVQELYNCHMGALPSYNEAFGIAALEYLRCGLPALVTRTGGLADSLPLDCRVMLDRDCSSFDIADVLEYYLRNPDVFHQLRLNAQANARFASWDRCLQDFQRLWARDATL